LHKAIHNFPYFLSSPQEAVHYGLLQFLLPLLPAFAGKHK
jgi:hypothetical protein